MSIQHQVIIPQHPLESKIAAPMREYTSANQDTMATEPNNNITPVNGAVTPPAINGETVNQTLTIRMIMQGKEAGSIIGKKGDNVKKFREESGAKINISDSSCPERIVTTTGTTDQIYKAYSMICKKFEDDLNALHQLQNSTLPKPPVTVRLIVPASQCGSLIGKGGSKIKEIRETTGASIQVASEMLPNSTERAVTVSGTGEAIAQAIYHVCGIMLESPPKGATIPYRPKPAVPPVMYTAGGQPFAVQPGQFLPPADVNLEEYIAMLEPQPMFNFIDPQAQPRGGLVQYTPMSHPQNHIPNGQMKALGMHQHMIQQGGMIHLAQPGMMQGMPGGIPAGAMPRPPTMPPNHAQTHEMTIPNDLIGCIIGRGGSKINEIRQLSGATIKISNADEMTADRKVTITGTPETINAAQYLINASIELHKQLNLVAAAVQADPAALSALQGPPNTVHPAMVPVTSSGAVTGPPPPHSAAFFQSPHQSPYHFPPPMMTPIGTKQPSPPLHPQQQSHSPPQQVFHPSFLFPAGGAFNPAMFEAAAMVAAQQQQQVAQAQQAQQTALNNKMKTNTSSHQQLSAGTMTATQSLDHHHHHQHHNLTAVSHLMKRDHKYSPY